MLRALIDDRISHVKDATAVVLPAHEKGPG